MIMGKVLWIYGLDDCEEKRNKDGIQAIEDVFKTTDEQQVRLQTISN